MAPATVRSSLAALVAALLLACAPAAAMAHDDAAAQIAEPAAGATYRDGGVVRLRGGADSEATLAWRVVLHHGDHAHAVGTFSGAEAQFTALDDHGAEAFYEIALTATDAQGRTSTATREIHPELAAVALRSDPPGAGIAWAGGPAAPSPRDLSEAVGFRTAVSADPELDVAGCRYVFEHWSDGGARVHAVVVPAAASTLTALYAPAGGGCPDVSGAGLAFPSRRGPAVELSTPRAPTRVLRGTASDPDGVLFVKVALRRLDRGLGCRWWSARNRRFSRVRTSCARPAWMAAALTRDGWRLDLRARLRPGRYVLIFRSADRTGMVSRGLSDGIQQVPVELLSLPRG